MARDLIYTKTLRVYVSIETDADIMYWQEQLTKLHISPSLKTRKIITDCLLGFDIPKDFSIPKNPEEHLTGTESTANFNIKMEETSHEKIKKLADKISEQTKNYTSVSKLVKCLIRMSFKEQTEKTMLMSNPYSMYKLFNQLNSGAKITPVPKEDIAQTPATNNAANEVQKEIIKQEIKEQLNESVDEKTKEARKILEMMDSHDIELTGIPISSKNNSPTKINIKTGKTKFYD